MFVQAEQHDDAVAIAKEAAESVKVGDPNAKETTFGPVVSEALEDTHFSPADTDGIPVRYWVILEFVFWIDDTRAEVAAGKR